MIKDTIPVFLFIIIIIKLLLHVLSPIEYRDLLLPRNGYFTRPMAYTIRR